MGSRQQYKFGEDFNFKESEKPLEKAGRFLISAVACSVVLTLVLYGIFALVVNTDQEAMIKREIRMYQKVYPQLKPQENILEGSLQALESKDNTIYGKVFQNMAPQVDPVNSMGMFYGADTIPDTKLISYTYDKVQGLVSRQYDVEAVFRGVLRKMSSGDFVNPPMDMPVRDVSYPQIGAGLGVRMNPMLKVWVQHDGLDFIVPQGEPVYAAGEGYVSDVQKASGGNGNTVTISHDGGYTTRYAHLSTIYVREGQKVRKGSKIALAGMSGGSYAPHLHYEVAKNGKYLNPVLYMFASVSPEEFANMLYMSVNTKQSLD